MYVKVFCFAQVRDMLGESQLLLALPEGVRVGDLRGYMMPDLPQSEELWRTLRFAVNEFYVPPETPLHPGDEVALIPPVAGG